MLRALNCCAIAIVLVTSHLVAADIDSDVSTRETYVGLPIVLRISINNAVEHETPLMPDVDGLKIEQAGPPSESRQVISVNGRRTQRTTLTYAFQVTPLREGTFTIPPVQVVADGVASITKAMRIVAVKSETNDLIFVEIEGSESEIYVGEAIDLKLKIWLRPYRNEPYQIEFDEGDMWQCISNQSAWGPFQERLEQLAQNRQRPGGRPVLREDSTGTEREYFLYEIGTTVYPDRPTNIDGQDVRIIVNYPVELGRSRGPFSMLDDDVFGGSLFDDPFFKSFGRRVGITKSRPLVSEAKLDPIAVKPVPTQGRPGGYVGAVGRYSIASEATPTNVQVGDPVTLHLYVEGTGAMDVVRAPPLAIQQDLVRDFKVPDEPLAGMVHDSVKRFTTTIRPLREDVTEIPPIEYSYFDPENEQYVTVKSQPIPIEVRAAEVLALDSIVGSSRSTLDRSPTASPLTSVVVDSTSLFTGSDVLASVPRAKPWSVARLAVIAAPPVLFLLIVAYALRALPGSWMSASRKLRRSLQRAESGSEIAAALEAFLVTRFRLAPGRLTRDQTIGALRGGGRHDLAIRVERIYQGDDRVDPASLEQRKKEAGAIASEVGRRNWSFGSQAGMSQLGSTTATIAIVTFLGCSLSGHLALAASLDLTPTQQQLLLEEAIESYDMAVDNPDQVEASRQFQKAIDNLQLLIDSGIQNDRLYFNLAEVAARVDRPGIAIANYRRALRMAPDNARYFERLSKVQQQAGIPSNGNDGLLSQLYRLNGALLRWVPANALLGTFLITWGCFWVVLSIRVLGFSFRWRLLSSVLLAAALLCAASYLLHVSEFTRDNLAVITSPSVVLRRGDGESFPEIATLDKEEGQLVRVLDRRGDWVRISSATGYEGWIPVEGAAEI